jgi:aryl-alcohol dehydrogenase-like predicted oxidoreductase
MDYVRLGRTGLKVSRICLGTMTYGSTTWRDWVLDEKEARPFYKRAIELGITFFDTADMYSLGASEEVTGRALRDMAKRDEVVVASWTRFVSMQNHYNLVYREEEREMVSLCVDQGIGMVPWSPLARGFLAGNRTQDKGGATTRSKSDEYAHKMYYQSDDFAVLDRVKSVAAKIGKTMPQVALAWMLSKPYITAPIVGASKPAHLEQAVEALSISLAPEQIRTLEEPYRPHPVMGH